MHFLLEQIYVVSKSLDSIDQGDPKEKLANMDVEIIRFENWKNMVKPDETVVQVKIKKNWNVNWRSKAKETKRR